MLTLFFVASSPSHMFARFSLGAGDGFALGAGTGTVFDLVTSTCNVYHHDQIGMKGSKNNFFE